MAAPSRTRILPWVIVLVVTMITPGVIFGDRALAGGDPPIDGLTDVVYVAVATNFPDSLGAGPAAGLNGSPIILVPTDPPIPGPTQTELLRLDPRELIIIGGHAVVSPAMESELAALLPDATVNRIGGADRYETNALLSQSVFPVEGWVSISAPAFTTPQPASDGALILAGGAYHGGGELLASIQLPHGAQILEMTADIHDDDGSQNVTVALYRAALGEPGQTIAVVHSSGSSGHDTWSTTAISAGAEIVDNENDALWIEVTNTLAGGPGANRYVARVMVRYRVGTPGA